MLRMTFCVASFSPLEAIHLVPSHRRLGGKEGGWRRVFVSRHAAESSRAVVPTKPHALLWGPIGLTHSHITSNMFLHMFLDILNFFYCFEKKTPNEGV